MPLRQKGAQRGRYVWACDRLSSTPNLQQRALLLAPKQVEEREPEIGPALLLNHAIGLPHRGHVPPAATRAYLILVVEIVTAAAKDSVGFPPMPEERSAAELAELADWLRKREIESGIRRRSQHQLAPAATAKARARGTRAAASWTRLSHS